MVLGARTVGQVLLRIRSHPGDAKCAFGALGIELRAVAGAGLSIGPTPQNGTLPWTCAVGFDLDWYCIELGQPSERTD